MSTAEVLEYYRFRWQIELVFKRFKSILAMVTCPSMTTEFSGLLYGKLLVALLTQKARTPWFCYFPLGLTISGQPRVHSPWREFQFALTNSRKPSHRD